MKTKVTVAIPVFNGEKYIREALQSIVDQTIKVDNITICDNCSTDNTVDIVQRFKDTHKDFKIDIYVNESNLGYHRNFNKCMELASTDYLLLLSADDRLKNNTIEIAKTFLDKNPDYAFVAGYADNIDSKSKIIHKHEDKQDQFYKKGEILEFLQHNRLFLIISSILLRVESIRKIGYWDLYIGPDERYWPKVIKQYPIAILNNCLTDRRSHLEQTGTKDYIEKYHDVVLSLKKNLAISAHESTSDRKKQVYNLIRKQNSESALMMGNLAITQQKQLWVGIKFWAFAVQQYPAIVYKTGFIINAIKKLLYAIFVNPKPKAN
jgi:glycosyltransferase involved in cell wall biosynthesis